MSTNFPSDLDTFTNPNGSDSLNAAAVPHAEQHANANDAIKALQAKVGINGSAVATSLDYRISAAETGLDGKISSSEKGSANGVATLGFDGKVPSSQLPPLDYIPTSEKGAAGGVAGLDEAGKVPAAQLPSYVDDVQEFANLAAFPVTGEVGKIYVALDTNKTYRWSGSTYIYITSGAVDSVSGKTGVVVLTKADVGLGSVDNTSDADKPVSTAQQSALDLKLNTSGGTITANSTYPALKITQTGAGNALVVEDEASDTTPFVIDSAGRVGIGQAAAAGTSLRLGAPITGSHYSQLLRAEATVQADVSEQGRGVITLLSTAEGTFNTKLAHFQANQGTIGAGSVVTSQYGFMAEPSLIGATSNFGFYSNIPSGTGRWNFYAAGTAANYFAGNVTANAAFNQTPTRSTVASGSTVTLTTGTNHLLYDKAATVAALTVTLPSASLTDGQVITIATRSAITALTVNGGTIYGAPTTLADGGFCSFIYSSSAAAWFRKG